MDFQQTLMMAATQGSGWTPFVLGASLLGFWDADQSGSLTLSTANVVTWVDMVGGYAPTQAVAGKQPLYSATSFNGRPGITFDGTDDFLSLASVPFPINDVPCEIWILASQDGLDNEAGAAGRVPFRYGGVAAETSRSANRLISATVNRARIHAGNGTVAVAAIDTSVVYFGIHLLRARFEAAQLGISVDGGAFTYAANSLLSSTGVTVIGASTAAVPGAFWKGAINTILVTALLDDAQAASLTAFLKARGGLA